MNTSKKSKKHNLTLKYTKYEEKSTYFTDRHVYTLKSVWINNLNKDVYSYDHKKSFCY